MESQNLVTKNYFYKDLVNPIWIVGVGILLFFHPLGSLLLVIAMILYAMWRSNVVIVSGSRLVFYYTNWVFNRFKKDYPYSKIDKVNISPYGRGAYAGTPFFDIYYKNGEKKRETYSPSIKKEEINEIIKVLETNLGNGKVKIVN